MKTALEILSQYSEIDMSELSFKNEIQLIRPSEAIDSMNQYAKEAIQEVLKQYYAKNIEAMKRGNKMVSINDVYLEVIKNLK